MSGWARGDGQNTNELKALLLAVAGVEEETELTGRSNDTRIVQYLKPVPDTTETPVTDTVSDATDEDMFVSGGGSAADVDTSSDSEEEEPPQRPQRNRRAPRRVDV